MTPKGTSPCGKGHAAGQLRVPSAAAEGAEKNDLKNQSRAAGELRGTVTRSTGGHPTSDGNHASSLGKNKKQDLVPAKKTRQPRPRAQKQENFRHDQPK